MKRILIPAIALTLLAATAQAQTLSGVKVEPAAAHPGQAVKITASFENAESPNCNVRVHFGDGASKDFKINQAKDVPLVTEHAYAKAGSYTVSVQPRSALPMVQCAGNKQSAVVKVAAPAKTAAAAAAPAPACPDGWKLDAKSVNKKTGAFTCTAKAGTALPASKLACAAPLGYFENSSKGQLGCRP